MHFAALDPRTLGVALNLVVVCLTLISVLFWRTKQMYPGFGRWAAGRIVTVLITVFGIAIGTWPHATVLTAVCGLSAAILCFEACRQFIGRKPSVRWVYVVALLLVAHIVIAEQFSQPLRINYVEIIFTLGLIHLLSVITLLRGPRQGKTPGRITTGILFLIRSFIDMLRCYHFLAYPDARLFDSSPLNLGLVISTVMDDVLLNFSFFLMHYERAFEEKAEEIRHAKEANQTLMALKGNLEERVQQRTAELVRSQKLESVARLAGGVAHDFNNVLMVVNGYSGLLLAQLTPQDPMYEAVAQIGKAGERAAGITRQLLTFSRQSKDHPRIFSVSALVREMVCMLRRLIGEDVEIVLNLAENNTNIRADRGQIEQVLMNLAINARDAMPGGGKLFIRTAVQAVTEEFGVPPGEYALLSVADTGVGMTAEVQSHIFEPFFTTKGHQGTGLGLSTTYGIVKQSGGGITVESTPGFGATFSVFLPLVEPTESELGPADGVDSAARGTETILLVEDQEDVCRFLREILAKGGYQTLAAAGGSDAIRIANQWPASIHLLITDIVLPQMNASEIVNQIRPIHPEIRVLMISGYTAERLDGQIDGATPYLEKPFTAEKLLKKVREILDAASMRVA